MRYVRVLSDSFIYREGGTEALGIIYKDTILPVQHVEDDKLYLQWDDHQAYLVIDSHTIEILSEPFEPEGPFILLDESKVIKKVTIATDIEVRSSLHDERRLALLYPGSTYSVVGETDDAYEIIIGNQIGFIDRIDQPPASDEIEVPVEEEPVTPEENQESVERLMASSIEHHENGEYFRVIADDVSVYDNRTGKLVKVGQLHQGQVYPRVRDYGNWHQIKFGDHYGYVRKSLTELVDRHSTRSLCDHFSRCHISDH